MDIVEIGVAFVTAIIAATALFVSIWSAYISKKTMHYQILHNLQNDYRSSEIMVSIAALQQKHKECFCKNKSLKTEFIKQYEKEKKDGIPINETLNYYRRDLTYFYSNLAFLYKYKILTKKMVFNWWTPEDFEMIDKFIIPLQEAIGEHLGSSEAETKFAMRHLQKIKSDSITYFQKNRNKP